ncbi:MAG: hypothetical protein K2Q03_10115 [Sphingobacteriaceae bacterium]|nr:hypothetical protein [Sphingobacteriaceae bacterium]
MSGTQGYALTPVAAIKLLMNAAQWLEPVDDYIDKSWKHGIPSYCLVPYIVTPNDDEPSHMQTNTKAKMFFPYKITREIYRFYSDTRRLIFNFRCDF